MARIAVLLIFATRAWACVCGGNWPSAKQMWKQAPAVFLGTVTDASPEGNPRDLMFQEQSVRIRVDEAFKGVIAGQTIALYQGADDCSGKFALGERAVFYLYPGSTAGSWLVPWCTRAMGSGEQGGDDLLFLHGLPKSAIGTRLSGEVELYEDSPQQAFKKVGGIPNVRVKISGPLGFTIEAVTNSSGVYEKYGLRPGVSSVRIEVPKGLKIKFPVINGSSPLKWDDSAVILAREGGASVDFVLQADTRVSGRMLDAEGRPRKDVCIDLESVEGRGENGARPFDCSKSNGKFQMSTMAPGKYWLVARDEVKQGRIRSKSTLYYPGVRDRTQAAIISIEAGKYVDHVDIILPSDERRYKIAGKFQFVDGVPVGGATVTFTTATIGYTESTETSPDGSFGMFVLAGVEGQLDGRRSVFEPVLRKCPGFRVEPRKRGLFSFMDATPIPLLVDSNRESLELKLPFASCESWPK
jgi:hypothetical protein